MKRGDDYILKVVVTDLTSRKIVVIPNDLKRYSIDPDAFSIEGGDEFMYAVLLSANETIEKLGD